MIEVKDLVFEYPNRRVFDGISFAIAANTTTALVGKNGSGKTTLLECLAGLRKPFSGEIYINGVDIAQKPRKSNSIVGFLPTFYGLYDALTVQQNLDFFAAAHNIPRKERSARIGEMSERLVLSDFLSEKAGVLSRGGRQRLVLAQAFIHKPQILLLEKPGTGLDFESKQSLNKLLKSFSDDGATIFFATHVLSGMETMVTDLLQLENNHTVTHQKLTNTKYNQLIHIELNTTAEQYRSAIEALTENDLMFSDNKITIFASGNEAQAQTLLNQLIAKKIPITSFNTKTLLEQ